MGKNTPNNPAPAPATGGGNGGGNRPFTPTFRKYADMTQGEKDAFKQGATTANNGIKEKLGLKKPKN